MPLTIKQFDSRSSRDLEYYKLALTHHDVMRYSDQEEGALVQDTEGKVKRQGGQMVFCVAYGPARKAKPEADSGISPAAAEAVAQIAYEQSMDNRDVERDIRAEASPNV